MQVCTSLQTDNHASTPPLSFLQAGCPSCRPTNSVKALKAQRQPNNNNNNIGQQKLTAAADNPLTSMQIYKKTKHLNRVSVHKHTDTTV